MLEPEELYQKYLRGERLTYQERTEIVANDKGLSSWQKMDIRLDAMYIVEKNDQIDLQDKISLLESARGESSMIEDIVSKEYYEMSRNEKQVTAEMETEIEDPTILKMDPTISLEKLIEDQKDREVTVSSGDKDIPNVEPYEATAKLKRISDGVLIQISKAIGVPEFTNTDLFIYDNDHDRSFASINSYIPGYEGAEEEVDEYRHVEPLIDISQELDGLNDLINKIDTIKTFEDAEQFKDDIETFYNDVEQRQNENAMNQKKQVEKEIVNYFELLDAISDKDEKETDSEKEEKSDLPEKNNYYLNVVPQIYENNIRSFSDEMNSYFDITSVVNLNNGAEPTFKLSSEFPYDAEGLHTTRELSFSREENNLQIVEEVFHKDNFISQSDTNKITIPSEKMTSKETEMLADMVIESKNMYSDKGYLKLNEKMDSVLERFKDIEIESCIEKQNDTGIGKEKARETENEKEMEVN